jgi:hypothetical protein
MWSTLVGLIERWWREKPRLDVVRTVVQLRDAMIECQAWYERYADALKAGDLETLYPHPRDEWLACVTRLNDSMRELNTALSIFSPSAYEALTNYAQLEMSRFTADTEALEIVASDLQQPLDLDIEHVVLGASFAAALEQLREFIAKNFKVEEIHAVARSRWR